MASPEPDKTWRVQVSTMDDCVRVEGHQGNSCGRFTSPRATHGAYVKPPNFIERWLGITFSEKIFKRKRKCQAWCDRQNAKEARAREVMNCLEPPTRRAGH